MSSKHLKVVFRAEVYQDLETLMGHLAGLVCGVGL